MRLGIDIGGTKTAFALAPPVLRRVGRLAEGFVAGAASEAGSRTSRRRPFTSTT